MIKSISILLHTYDTNTIYHMMIFYGLIDVGLTWLAEGCKAIEELDLHNCDKVSDAGMRSIANGCHALTSIDISSATG